MKQTGRYMAMITIAIFFIAGCSKQPLQEINTAKAAVDSIVSDGSEKYLPEDTKKINDDLNKAMAEVQAQDAKLIKNYGKAQEMLGTVKSEADAVAAKLPSIKDAAKKTADSAMQEARASIDEAGALADKVSKGKGKKPDVAALGAELKALEDSFKELQSQVERADYLTVASRAAEIKGKASAFSEGLKQLPEKADKKRK